MDVSLPLLHVHRVGAHGQLASEHRRIEILSYDDQILQPKYRRQGHPSSHYHSQSRYGALSARTKEIEPTAPGMCIYIYSSQSVT